MFVVYNKSTVLSASNLKGGIALADKLYLCIDLKSFYASVECRDRGLDPLDTNLVVADASKSTKTICLAVSPSLKTLGIPGRPRLFEVVQKVKYANYDRLKKHKLNEFSDSSYSAKQLLADPKLAIDYITAPPRMAQYMKYSSEIYKIYLKYIAPEDIHVYSIDEVFMDITNYLPATGLSPHDFAMVIIKDVLKTTGITATAGIGTNLYLAKIAMDIVAKHIPADKDGVRVAQLDEISYRKKLWDHRPLKDFWRVGKGYVKKLEANGLFTMGDIARCSIGPSNQFYNEELLYKMFGVNAELLIDHAWGYEPCTMADIKSYKHEYKSIGSGQVLTDPYPFDKAKLVVREMTDLLVLDLVDKGVVTDQIVLTVGYDVKNLEDPKLRRKYHGEIKTDSYGRKVPKHAHGTANLPMKTSSTKIIMEGVLDLFDRIVNKDLLVRRVNMAANHVILEQEAKAELAKENHDEQLDFFTNYQEKEQLEQQKKLELSKEKQMQQAMINIKKKFGKNAILKGTNLEDGATTITRNGQIGGHKA